MILSELIGAPVVEGGHRVGRVSDVRFVLDETPPGHDPLRSAMPSARLYGVLVSPRAPQSFLGYERVGVTRPWPLAQLLRRRERGSFLVLWRDVAELSGDGVLLRPDAVRWAVELPAIRSGRRGGSQRPKEGC